jgi:hypothetical protein
VWRACVECPPVRAGGFCFAGLIPAMVKKPGSFSGEKIDMGAPGASARRGLSSFKAMSSSSGGRRPSLYFTGAGSQPACDHGAIDPVAITDHVTRRAPSSVIWRAIHSAVGLVVTLIQTRSRRSIRKSTKPYSSLQPMVGTTNKSMAATSGAWFRRKVRHPLT